MPRPIWKDTQGRDHFVDEMSDKILKQNYDFICRWVDALNEKIDAAWVMHDLLGDGLAIDDVANGIERLNEELITSVGKRTTLHREMIKRGIQ